MRALLNDLKSDCATFKSSGNKDELVNETHIGSFTYEPCFLAENGYAAKPKEEIDFELKRQVTLTKEDDILWQTIVPLSRNRVCHIFLKKVQETWKLTLKTYNAKGNTFNKKKFGSCPFYDPQNQ